jgi:hypothetical protein
LRGFEGYSAEDVPHFRRNFRRADWRGARFAVLWRRIAGIARHGSSGCDKAAGLFVGTTRLPTSDLAQPRKHILPCFLFLFEHRLVELTVNPLFDPRPEDLGQRARIERSACQVSAPSKRRRSVGLGGAEGRP